MTQEVRTTSVPALSLASRHGHGPGSVSLGGRRVPVRRPRMRPTDGSGELPVPSYELFSQTEVLGRMAMEHAGRAGAGRSAHRASRGKHLEVGCLAPVRRRTATALAQLLAQDLSQLDLVGLMIDGVHFGEHCCVVALGIGIDGTKHPLALVEGSTENAALVTELIVGFRERGLDMTHPTLVVLDGSTALRRAVADVFDRPVLARCQLHKIRNVQDRLSEKLRSDVATRRRRAYHADSALAALRWPPNWTAPTPGRRPA